MPELPKLDVIYRIRNVDTRLYLERSLGPSAPQMRSEEVTSKRQHWRLTKLTNGPPVQYRILDPYASTLSALCYNPNPPPSTQSIMVAHPDVGGFRPPNTWTIVANTTNPNENAFYLLPNDPQGGPSVAFGNTIPNNVTPFVGFQMTPSDKDAPTAGGSFQWQISEVSPAALPEETNSKYRIRAFLGKPLQVDASGNLNLDPTDARGDHRVWTITDKGNGQCTVYSDKAQQFLTAMNVSTTGSADWRPTLKSDTAPTFIDADRTWTFEKTTSLTHTIFMERPITVPKATGPSTDLCKLALALDGNNAILKPKKLAHNEVWMVEPIDLPMPSLAGSGNPGVTPSITPGGTSGLGFPPGLQGNVTYRVRNPESPSVSNPDHIRCGYTFASGASAAQAAGIRVETKTNGGVALYCLDSGPRFYLGLSGDTVVTNQLNVSDNAYAWTVTRVSLTGSGGQYTVAAANGQLLSTSISNNLVLSNANNPPSKWQVWNFS